MTNNLPTSLKPSETLDEGGDRKIGLEEIEAFTRATGTSIVSQRITAAGLASANDDAGARLSQTTPIKA